MSKTGNHFALRASVVAINAILIGLPIGQVRAADADEVTAAELTSHSSRVELGVGGVSQSSAKFGEYNGLNKSGAFGIGNIDLRGGGSFDSDDATRWRLNGTNLGLDNRNLSGEYGEQGRYRLFFNYDELRRNKSDTYQTPYNGAGSSTLTLPGNWAAPGIPAATAANSNVVTTNSFRGLIPGIGSAPYIDTRPASANAGKLIFPNAAQQLTVAGVQALDLPAFKNVNLYTERKSLEGGVNFSINNRWEIQASAKSEKKDGLKAMGALNLGTSPASILPDLIDTRTDQFNLSLNYRKDRDFSQVAYNGSLFHNNVKSMSFQNPFVTTQFSDISSPPSNQFHQLAYTGSYELAPKTRLAVNAAYGRNTQNDSLINDGTATLPLGLSTQSANAVVVTKALSFKLTGKAGDKLNLAGGYKYDNRDNQTPVNRFVFYDAGEAKSGVSVFNSALGLPAGTLGSNINIYSTRPYSKKQHDVNLDADYNLAAGHWLKGGLDYQQIERYCSGTWTNCADATRTREATLRAEWRGTAAEDLNLKAGYAYSKRSVKYDENAWLALVPMAGVVPTGATQSVATVLQQYGIGGYGFGGPYGALAGNLQLFFPNNSALQQGFYGSRNDIHELPGMRRYNMADRDRNKLRTSMDWQAMPRLNIFAGLDLNWDNYGNSTYGLQDSKNWNLNLDGTYAVSDSLSVNVFYSFEDQRSRSAGDSYSAGALTNAAIQPATGALTNTVVSGGCFSTVLGVNTNAKVDPCRNWSTDMRDRVDTLGVGFRHKGLWSGKLDLRGDLVRSFARTNVGINGGNYVNNPSALALPAPAVATAIYYVPATALPTVTSDKLALSLRGQYTLNKHSSWGAMYRYQRLKATDYAYDAMQVAGTISSVMPTNEQAPTYRVHVVGVSYQYRF